MIAAKMGASAMHCIHRVNAVIGTSWLHGPCLLAGFGSRAGDSGSDRHHASACAGLAHCRASLLYADHAELVVRMRFNTRCAHMVVPLVSRSTGTPDLNISACS